MKKNNKTLLLIYLRGAFSLIVLLIVYYLIINSFNSIGLQDQTRLALIFGGIHGFLWTLWLFFIYPKLNQRSFIKKYAIGILVIGAFLLPSIVWFFNNKFEFVPFFISYALGISPAFFITWILITLFRSLIRLLTH